jgi:hypothetical protein
MHVVPSSTGPAMSHFAMSCSITRHNEKLESDLLFPNRYLVPHASPFCSVDNGRPQPHSHRRLPHLVGSPPPQRRCVRVCRICLQLHLSLVLGGELHNYARRPKLSAMSHSVNLAHQFKPDQQGEATCTQACVCIAGVASIKAESVE